MNEMHRSLVDRDDVEHDASIVPAQFCAMS